MSDGSDGNAAVNDAVARAKVISSGLLQAVPVPASWIRPDAVPRVPGIYLWRFLANGKPAYVGITCGRTASSRRGLYKRIVKEHLRAGYLNPDKSAKSVFRRAVVEYANVDPGDGAVSFIRAHFSVALLGCPNDGRAVLEAAEAMLIADLDPKFNTAGKAT